MVIFQYNLYIFFLSIFEPCYIQNRVIMNRVIKRLKVYVEDTHLSWPEIYISIEEVVGTDDYANSVDL